MKVNVISPWYPDYASPYSGIFVEKQVEALRRYGQTVSVEVPQIFPAPGGPVPRRVVRAMEHLGAEHPDRMYHSNDGVTYIPAPVPAGSGFIGRAQSFAASIELKRRVLPHAADITHAHLGVPTGWAALKLGDSPIVVTEHQSTLAQLFAQPSARKAYEEVIAAVDAFVCVSHHLRDQIEKAIGEEATERVEVIPNIIDVEAIRFAPPSEIAFRSWLYIGSLSPHKGVEKLLRAFLAYRQRFDPSVTLTLVGEGALRAWIESFARSNDCRPSINLVGAVPHSDIGRYLAVADVMVHMSPYETFGIATLEALAAGLPVISTRNTGVTSSWGAIESACGVLLDASTGPTEVAETIAELRDDPSRLQPEIGRRLVEESYSPEVVARRLYQVYERCLART